MVKNKKKRLKSVLVSFLMISLGGSIGWFFFFFFESSKPIIQITNDFKIIGASQTISGIIHDTKTGIRKIQITLIKDNQHVSLYKQEFDFSVFKIANAVKEHPIHIQVIPKKLLIPDGAAQIQFIVEDNSFRRWFKGNRIIQTIETQIDTTPPRIEILSKHHYLTQGGAGIVIYRVSELNTKNGVQVGERFYEGYSGYFDDPLISMVIFALRYDQGPDTKIYVLAKDQADNQKKASFYYRIRKRRFKKDRINISDGFLRKKMPEFQERGAQPSSLVDTFLKVNRKIRKENSDLLISYCRQSDNTIYWKGSFLRLPGSATRATFGDIRSYYYHRKKIDQQTHLGIDLASTQQAQIPAANDGKIVFCSTIGIYGKVILIDHGMGLFSMYSHLSRFVVEAGQMVKKGDIIGYSGETGMAAGDHLHFSMVIQGTFCNPIEWWDPRWVKNRIIDKINLFDRKPLD